MSTENYDNSEHNPSALAKRVLNIGYDYKTGTYKVPGLVGEGAVKVQLDVQTLSLLKNINKNLGLMVAHLEHVTGEQITSEELKDC